MTEQRREQHADFSGNTEAHPADPAPATRRRILKGLAAGIGVAAWHSALPERWTAPIIESISLPAHAQTSAPAASPGTTDPVEPQPNTTEPIDQPVDPIEPVDPPPEPKTPISPCSPGVSNLLDEDITLIHDGTEYTIKPGGNFPDLTVYEEPFSLTFRGTTGTNKTLVRSAPTTLSVPFTDEVTVNDAGCGDRYTIGT